MYNKGEVDFSRITTFNLDEYYPIAQSDEQSYHTFMNKNLFEKINIDLSRIHIPNGETADPAEECNSYERAIKESGGVDLQILGIGRNGHIGFNEPGMRLNTRTHITALTADTIEASFLYSLIVLITKLESSVNSFVTDLSAPNKLST